MADSFDAPPEAPGQPLPALRRVRHVGPAAAVAVIAISFAEHPAPGLAGSRLAVTLSLLVMAAASMTLLRRDEAPITAVVIAAMIVASAALVWLQPTGTGDAGLFVAIAVAGVRLADRQSLIALGLAMAAYISAALHADRPAGVIGSAELGIVAFYLVARFGRVAAEAHEDARRLLVELQASRHAAAEAAALRERSRLARDMHDVLAHSLSGLMLQLEGARMLSAQPGAGGQLSPALDRAHHLARAGLEEARRAIAALRDEDLPGPDRLQQLAADFEQDSQISASLTVNGTPRGLGSEASLTLYRVAQEALTNSRKHGSPERIDLRLNYEGEGTRLTISDHASRLGRPSPAVAITTAGGGYGLTGMRERAELLGGRLDTGQTTDGFRVELWIPA